MIAFVSGALGFGFAVGFLCDCFRSITMMFMTMLNKVS
jgi:hypothetical protein